MELYNYHADDLEEDEVDYELGIRGIASNENLENKRRELRLLINEDRKNPKLYTTTVTLEQEAEWIADRIRSIRKELERKLSLRAQSRLISLRNRVLRAPSADAFTKNTFIGLIDATWKTYFGPNPNQNAEPNSEDLALRISDYTRAQPLSTSLNPQAPAYRPNSINQPVQQRPTTSPNNSFSIPVMTSSPGHRLRPLGNVNLPVNQPIITSPVNRPAANLNLPTEPFVDLPRANQANVNLNFPSDSQSPKSHGRQTCANLNIHVDPPLAPQPSTSANPIPLSSQNLNLFTTDLKDFIRQAVKDAVKDYVDEYVNFPTPNFSSVFRNAPENPIRNDVGINTSEQQHERCQNLPQLNEQQTSTSARSGNQQAYPPNYYNHLRTKIEKWQIFFNGEIGPRSSSVTEFIRQVTILAKANHVSDAELLQQAYIFFTGEARRWYFTYWEKFTTWQHLVYYLTMTFENPNKDKAIEDEMRERKQRPNERFSAYLADMERLSQSLTRKMDPSLKFKLIFDNTKLSYRRRLALIRVMSINELAEYCYQFDALEPSLYAISGNRANTQTVHQVDLDEFEELSLENSDPEEVNAINNGNKYANKNRFTKKEHKFGSTSNATPKPEPKTEDEENMVHCWNCRSAGHFAKYCQQPRRMYCFACGEPNVSKATCPRDHYQKFDSKNEN